MDKYTTVDEFIAGLDAVRQSQVQILRKYILDEAPSLVEHIKWNAPSYVKDNEDRITFNTINKEQVVKLVFHMGAIRKEKKNAEPLLKDADLVEWVSDIRGYMTFRTLDDIVTEEVNIKNTMRRWLELS